MEMTEDDDTVTFVTRDILLDSLGDRIRIISSRHVGYTGCKEYVVVARDEDLSEIKRIACVKLYFQITIEMEQTEENEMVKMVKSHCERKLGHATTNGNYTFHIERDKIDDMTYTHIYPMYDKEWIWLLPNETRNVYFDFNPYVGLCYLGDSPLYIVAAREIDFPSIKWIGDFVLYTRFVVQDIRNRDLNDMLDSVYSRVERMKQDGFTSYDEVEKFDICRDICQRWEIEVLTIECEHFWFSGNVEGEYDLNSINDRFLLLNSMNMFGCTLCKWLSHAIERNLFGQNPFVIVKDKRNLSIPGAQVLPDGSISVSVASLSDLQLDT